MRKGTLFLLLLSMVLLITLCFSLVQNNKLEEKNKCYAILYDHDIIGSGCDKYFQNDKWYIEYMEEVARQ